MKAEEIKIGLTYEVRISNRLRPVRVDGIHSGGGWRGTNLDTGASVRIIGPSKFRGLYVEGKTKRPIGPDQGDQEFKAHAELEELADEIIKELTPDARNNLPSKSNGRNFKEQLYSIINDSQLERAGLEQLHGKAWDRKEIADDFAILGFHPPFAVVRRQADDEIGTLLYQEGPRYYFRWHAKKSAHVNNKSGE